jgi:ABC-type branched-subunit amino acid transport system ATPase component
MGRTLLATPLGRNEAASERKAAERVLDMAGLSSRAGAAVSSLPAVDQRLVMIATAYASSPKVLLIDEPSAGLSGLEEAKLNAFLEALRAEGTALVLVEHNLHLVRALADRVTVLDAGVVIAEGTVSEIAADPLVREAYLGPSLA